VCLCFEFESDLSKLRLQNTEKSKLADLSIRTADPKRTRYFVNMQPMARQLSLVYMFSIDRIKSYSEWKRCENRLRVNKFLRKPSKVLDFGWHRALVSGFKLHTTIVLMLCKFVMGSQFGPIGFSELKVKYLAGLLTNSIVLLYWSEQKSRYVAC